MTHEDLLGLPLDMALALLSSRGICVEQVVWTCAPRNPQPEGSARVVAFRQEGRIVVAARFLDSIVRV